MIVVAWLEQVCGHARLAEGSAAMHFMCGLRIHRYIVSSYFVFFLLTTVRTLRMFAAMRLQDNLRSGIFV